MLDVEDGIAPQALQGNRASFADRGKSHVFSRGVLGMWGILSSCNGDGPSRLVFVQ